MNIVTTWATTEMCFDTDHEKQILHTYMAFHFINLYKPLGFGYETCLQDLTNSNRYTQNKTYTHTIKILKFKILQYA